MKDRVILEKYVRSCPELGRGREMGMTPNGYSFFRVKAMKMFELTVVMAAQLVKMLKTTNLFTVVRFYDT